MRLAAGATAIAVALTVALAGCGKSDAEKAKEAANSSALPTAGIVCAKDGAKAVSLPAGFPTAFPLPVGTVVTSAENRGTSGLVITGVTKSAFKDVLKGLQTDLPAKGFTPKNGETEPRDAESDWSSTDFDGRWAIRELSQCNGETAVSVVARKK